MSSSSWTLAPHSGRSPIWAFLLANFDLLIVTAFSVVAVVPFGELFVSNRSLVLAVGAVLLAVAVNLVLNQRTGVGIQVLIGVLGLALYLTFVVFHVGVPRASELRAVWHGTTNSWADLLTATVPAGTRPGLAALPVLVAWAAAEVGSIFALRTSWKTAPAFGPLGAFVIALLFTGQQSAGSTSLVGIVVALLLALVVVRANPLTGPRQSAASTRGYGLDVHGRSTPLGQIRLGLVVIAVMALVAVVLRPIQPFASETSRIDLHDRYDPPFDLNDAISPLALVRAGLNDTTNTTVFTVRFFGIPKGMQVKMVRTAVLDSYDGTVWGTDASFALAGTELPPGQKVVLPTESIRQDYELTDYSSSFLPGLDRPRTLSGATTFGFDRASGMVLAGSNNRKGLKYSVTSDVPKFDRTALTTAKAGNDPVVSRLAIPPPNGWPKPIQQFAAQFPPGKSEYDTLVAMQDEFLSLKHFGYDEHAKTGHSLKVLSDFLSAQIGTDSTATGRVGYSEQFAAAFAVVARVKGWPSRVVVGYQVDPVAAARGDVISVKRSKIHAWAEVNINGVGWVTFDPTNQTPRKAQLPETPPPTVPITVAPVTPNTNAPPVPLPVKPPVVKKTSIPLAPLIVVGALLLLVASVPTAKSVVRKRRRTRGTAADQTLGAWLESRDQLRTHGMQVPRSATVAELAAISSPELSSSLNDLAPIVDSALYAPEDPDESSVTDAWDAQEALTDALAVQSGVAMRVRAALDPRPLVDGLRKR